MQIKLKNGKAATEEACLRVQNALLCQLSKSFRNFVRDNDGALPESNIFKVRGKTDPGISINRFIPTDQILGERDQIESIPKKAYPVAWVEGGNYIFIDEEKNGGVFFWDHETGKTVKLASDFGLFLQLLEPFDIQKIQLQPGQVKKVWIDPEFLRQLKK
jgi:hypothetical protein